MDDTDLRLLEAASKAAGEQYGPERNPLDRDDLALRLAVQCGIEVSLVDDEPDRDGRDTRACAGYATEQNPRIRYVFEDHRGDIFAATRRAIVRAAAAIAKGGE